MSPRSAASAERSGESRKRKTPLTAAERAAWTYDSATPIVPALSPPLRDVPPRRAEIDEGDEKEHERLPYRGQVGHGPVFADGAVQRSFGPNAPTPSGVNFDGGAANGSAPPDTNGAVGPNHYVQWVNTEFAIYDKAGTTLFGPAAGNTLFTALGGPCAAQNDGDPIVTYDLLGDRWVLSQFAIFAPPTGLASFQCVAVSATGDPLGSYYLYGFPLSPDLIFDYPKVSTWPDSYYASFHVFDGASQIFQNQGLVVFERAAMLAGLPARVQVASVGTAGAQEYFGGLPSDLDSLTPPPPGSPNYFIIPGSPEWDGSPAPTLHFFTASATWGVTPTLTIIGPNDIATAPFNTNLCNFARNCIPQPAPSGAADRLDSISGNLMNRLTYRNFGTHESLVMKQTVNALVPPANQAAARWYELRSPGSSPAIFQQGTFSPDAEHRWMGSIAMDNAGNMALGYSKSSLTTLPEIDLTGRLSGDALGTMGAEIVMHPGAGVQLGTANRWGDYSGMTVDTREGCTFWYTNQYQPANGSFNWRTRIASFRFSPAQCSSPARGTLTGVVRDGGGAPIEGALVTVDNGFSGATNELGIYTIVMPPGTYNVIASAPRRPGCSPSASSPVTITNGAVTTRDFTLLGTPTLVQAGVTIDDSAGNNNGGINQNECFELNLPLGNIGCALATDISAVLTTSTPGVTVVQGSSDYPDIPAGGSASNISPYELVTSPSLACGTPIDFTLTVTSADGVTLIPFSVPTCVAPAVVLSGALVVGDTTQTARLGRNGVSSACGVGKVCPGPFGAGVRLYDSYPFTNGSTVSRCVTVAVNPNCAEGGIPTFSGAYLGSYNPASLCVNYLADAGSSGANGTPVPYSFDVPAGATFIVVVSGVSLGDTCSDYTLTVEGLLDTSDGGRPPAPTVGSNSPVCVGGTLNLTASTIPGATYSWTGPNGFTSNLQNPSIPNVTLAAAGTYSVVATVDGCSSAAGTTTVVVNAGPSATITAPAAVCALSTGNVASVPDAGAGATYVWAITNGTITAGNGTPSITFTAGAAGPVTLDVTVTNAAGCSASDSETITVNTTGCGNFFTLTACRAIDTRVAGQGPAIAAGSDRTFFLTSACGLPSSATSVSANVTVTETTAAGNFNFFAGGSAAPSTSVINWSAGQTRANNAIIRLGPGGAITVRSQSTGTTQLILDLNGYFQ